MKILIAEDDLSTRNMLAIVLKKCGHETVLAVDGNEAWNAMQAKDMPQMAILDWMLPGLNGLEITRLIRAKYSGKVPYILILTTKGEDDDIKESLEAGANDYLGKPFSIPDLRAMIEKGILAQNRVSNQ